MSQNVTVKIQINDGGTFKDVTVNADDLANAINTVKDRADDLDKSLVSMASLGQIFDGLSSAVQNLHTYISNLTSDYKAAIEAETKLATAMRNTMDATDEEIQSIKDFCDEQEKMGVVAGDVQVSAAQELATYLEFSDSLKTLIPVVNDMTVQQYGLGASAESATQIATMLGKVMNGQTKALSRYGYEFTEAQEAVLLYGNEAERAAMLAEVVGQSVGGMNYEMAKTPVGVMQQAENRLGKMRENIGAFAIQMEPALKNLSLFTSTTADIVKVVQAIDAVKKSAIGLKAASIAAAVAQKTQAAAAKILGVAEYSAVTATKTLKVEIAALEATITLGVSAAIAGLITLITKLTKKSSEGESAIGGVDEATEEYGRAAGEARGQIMLEIGALEDIIEKHKKEKDKVDELNKKYGESFGYHSTAADWYDTLTTKSEAYCRQLGYEAKAKLLAAQYGEALVAMDDAQKTVTSMEKDGTWARMQNKVRITGGSMTDEDNPIQAEQYWQPVETEEYKAANAVLDQATSKVENLRVQLENCVTEGKAAAEALGPLGRSNTPPGGGDKLKGLPADLEDYRQSVERAVEANRALGGAQSDSEVKLSAMKSGLTSLVEKYGASDERIKTLISDYAKLRRASSEISLDMPSGKFSMKATAKPNSPTSAEKSDDIKAYYDTIGKAVEMNRIFGDGQSDSAASLAAMESALPGLIEKYGKNDIEIQKLIHDYETLKSVVEPATEAISGMEKAQTALSGISSAFSSLSDMVGEGAAAWLDWGANLLTAIAQALPAIGALTFAKKKEATANAAASVTGVASSVGSIPYVGPVLAIAAIASVIAALTAIPKFAKGGIAYGPTLGLFGEYAGAGHNPEVVAPLSDLKNMIGGVGGGTVEFRISGRDLYGVLERRQSFIRRG